MKAFESRYRQVFPGRHTVLPVIHVDAPDKLSVTCESLVRPGGWRLPINHGMADEALLDIHGAVADAHPDWWIGVNCLGLSPARVFAAVSPKVGGVWTDNARIEEGQERQP